MRQNRLYLLGDVGRKSGFELGNKLRALGIQPLTLHSLIRGSCARTGLENLDLVKQEPLTSSNCILMSSMWQSLYPSSNALDKHRATFPWTPRKSGDDEVHEGSGERIYLPGERAEQEDERGCPREVAHLPRHVTWPQARRATSHASRCSE